MVTNRMLQFDELIQKELSDIIHAEIPDVFSVTQVHVSKDLAHAKVWISAYTDVEKIVKRCQEMAKDLRKELSQRVRARKVPALYFVSDLTEEKAGKIEKLLKDIK